MLEKLAEDVKETRTVVDEMHTCLKVHIAQCEARAKLVDTHEVILNGPPGDTEGKGGLVGRARFYERTGGIAWAAFTTAIGTAFLLGVEWMKRKVIRE